MQAIDNKKSDWENSKFRGDYADAKRQSGEFINYKTSLKRTWVAEKRDLDTLLGNIQTKLKTYDLKPYHPPHGLSLKVSIFLTMFSNTRNIDQGIDYRCIGS